MNIISNFTLANGAIFARQNNNKNIKVQNFNSSTSCDCFFKGSLNPKSYLDEIEDGNATLFVENARIDFALKNNPNDREHLDKKSQIYKLLLNDSEKCKMLLGHKINGVHVSNLLNLSTVRRLSKYFDAETMKALIGAKDENGESIFIWNNSSGKNKKGRVSTLLELYGVHDKEFVKDVLYCANFFDDAKKSGNSFEFCDDMLEITSQINKAFMNDDDFLYRFYTKKDGCGKMLHEHIAPVYFNAFILDLYENNKDVLFKIMAAENSDGENYIQKATFVNSKAVRTTLARDPIFYAKMLLIKDSSGYDVFDYHNCNSIKGRFLRSDTHNILKCAKLDDETFDLLSSRFNDWKNIK